MTTAPSTAGPTSARHEEAGHEHADPATHGHGHHHHGLSHRVRREQARRLIGVLCLSATYMVAEVIGGLWTGSLALLADAGHMLSDVGSLALGLFALWIAQRPANARRTYGHTRVEILAALAQGTALIAVALTIAFEGFERLQSPREVHGAGMMAIATGGLLVNGIGLAVLYGGRNASLNLRGVWLHVLGDALGSVGAITAGLAVWWLGWRWADPVASLLICCLLVVAAWRLLREAVQILMESAPAHLDVDEIRRELAALPGVEDVHDLHVWTIGSGEVSLSSHLVAPSHDDSPALLRAVRELLAGRFGIQHSTVQIERVDDADDACHGACEDE